MLLYTKTMNKLISRLREKTGLSFFLLILFQMAILGGVMVLRSAWLIFQTTGVFYWKVFYSRGLPPVIAGCVICLAGIVLILIAHRESLRQCLREGRRTRLVLGILMLIGLAVGILVTVTRLGLEKENSFLVYL